MARDERFEPGDVISFRIPEGIASSDLDYLREIAKRPTVGKIGPISEFFFAKVSAARVEQGHHISIPLPDLSKEELATLGHPLFIRALSLCAYHLLGRITGDAPWKTSEIELNNYAPLPKQSLEKGTIVDPRAQELMRKLRG